MEKNKSKMGLGILIGVLATLVVVLMTFIIFNQTDKNKNSVNNNQDENQSENKTNTNEFVEISINDQTVKTLMSKILIEEKAGELSSCDFGYILHKEVTGLKLAKDLSESTRLSLIWNNITNTTKEEYYKSGDWSTPWYNIPKDIVDNVASNIFGSNYTINSNLRDVAIECEGITFNSKAIIEHYGTGKDTYVFAQNGDLATGVGNYKTTFTKAMKNNDTLIVNVQVEKVNTDNTSIISNYQYTFRKNNNSYYFYSIEKTK